MALTLDEEKLLEIAAALKAARAEVLRLEGEFRQIRIGNARSVEPAAPPPEVRTPVVGPTEAARVIAFLNRDPARAFNSAEIARGIGSDNIQNVRSVLARAFTAEKIARPERALYQALPQQAEESA